MDQHTSAIRGDSEGLWDWNLVSDRVHFSPRWISLVGCEDHEVGNTPEEWFQRVHPDDLGQVLREIEAARAEGSGELDSRHRVRHKSGAYRWMSCRAAVVRNEAGQAIRLTGSHSDVTVNTVTDPLTGLPNRLLLLDRLTSSVERASRYPGFHFAVLILDLGRPAAIPGSSGLAGGDALMTAAARRLETCLRIGDTTPSLRHNDLVARLQGDQFAVLLDGLKDVSHAKVVADRILAEILAPFTLSGGEFRLPASLGVAVSATGYVRAEDVLRDAETAVHRARMLGGSHCEVFDTAILKSEQAELQLEGDLKEALERREFHIAYQPIVSLASNQIVGFEALVRWQHPVLGLIPPLDFIPLAERTGFILPLGNWILREACMQLKAWQDSLPGSADLWMAVNLSGVQLKHPALIDQVGEALRDSGLEARNLVLELTEGIAMENPTAVKTLLMQLRARGVRISIDDFGTGYSSLAYLRQFPVDALKVDRSFVRGMETHKDTAEIMGSLTAMAQQLGLHVVAEGIENEDQLALLRSLRCESAQGYLFAKPLGVDRATELLKTGLPPRPASARDNKPALSPRSERRIPEARDGKSVFPTRSQVLAIGRRMIPAGRRLLPTGRRLAIAAGVLGLFMSAGFAALFTIGPLPVVLSPSPPPLPLVLPEQGPAVDTITDAGIPIPTSAMVTVHDPRAAPVAIKAGRKEDLPAAPLVQRPATVTSAAAVTPVVPEVSATANIPPPAVQTLTFLDLVHLHRVGSCQGRLIVSPDGVAFIPDDETGKDDFRLAYSEFLHTLEDSRLTIKSNDRTYRFKAAAVAGKDDDGSQLHDVLASIARFR